MELYPETAKEALDRWDKNETVFTVEMGGLGPSYEQCIHIVVFEIIRDNLTNIPKMGEPLGDWGDASAFRADKEFNLGLSGAQVGAAKNLAAMMLIRGWAGGLNFLKKEGKEDRIIQVCKKFPKGD